jgi:hypothetical protein
MPAAHTTESVAQSLRPVVIVVVAAKMAILGFLFANMAGILPTPAVAEASAIVHVADAEVRN